MTNFGYHHLPSGVLAAIDIAGHEFPVHVDKAYQEFIKTGYEIAPYEIFIATKEIRAWWPFELIGWIKDAKKWLVSRTATRSKCGVRMIQADDETVQQIIRKITSKQQREFHDPLFTGKTMRLSEYLDMSKELLIHADVLLKAGAPVYWDVHTGFFSRNKLDNTYIKDILKHMLGCLERPLVVEFQDKPHMKFNDWFCSLLEGDCGLPHIDREICPADTLVAAEKSEQESDEECIPEVDNSVAPEPLPEPPETMHIPESACAVSVIPPETANDDLGIHDTALYDVDLQMVYTITLRNPSPSLLTFIEEKVANKLIRTRYSCEVDAGHIYMRYSAHDIREPLNTGTDTDAVCSFPDFVDTVLKLIKAYNDIESAAENLRLKVR